MRGLLHGALPHAVALHGYNLGDGQAGALRRRTFAVYRRLQPRVFRFLRRAGLKGQPPVLGFHRDQDRTVPVKEAEDLRDLLADRGLQGEVQIYKGVGHVFRKGGQVQPAIVADAEGQAAAFLEKHLQRGAGREPGQ
jgi:dienelactone hydrolase